MLGYMKWCEKIIHLNLGSLNYYTMSTDCCLVGSDNRHPGQIIADHSERKLHAGIGGSDVLKTNN